jgi:hypothetical protein
MHWRLEAARQHSKRIRTKVRSRLGRSWCPICEARTAFIQEGPWLRDQLFCAWCRSIPRWRALLRVLHDHFPNWRELRVHESSPGGPASDKLERECHHYLASHFFPDVPLGQTKGRFRCENLEDQTFPDGSFDLVVTSDVFEHILDPARAFAEIARTLRNGGAHVFTVPWYYWKDTLVRAVHEGDEVRHLEPPDYHGNPIDAAGSLVVTEWGHDLCDFIYRHSGMTTTAVRIRDAREGIDGEFREVFISRKPG